RFLLRRCLLLRRRLAGPRRLRLATRLPGLARARGEQLHRLFQRDRLRVGTVGQRSVDLAVVDVGAVAAGADGDRPTLRRMVAELLDRRGGDAAAPRAAAGFLFGEQRDRAVVADRKDLVD